ncbi:hypothetical protein [Georgenia subflava]|uniref:Uncharacterized protein n=1 Tax=Georgenia subflava TaxID=1622177 RepID=A0A6N7EHH8_9MICO|nr:hypothetical protein [Georgenia subflava]MPV36167.1 hypothetical protein [Georgenia subflava]
MDEELRLDTELLLETADSLSVTREEFAAGTVGDNPGLGDAVGNPRLYGRLNSFQNSWNVSRERLVESIDVLGRTMVTVAEAFAELDAELAKGLGAGTPGGAANAPRAV